MVETQVWLRVVLAFLPSVPFGQSTSSLVQAQLSQEPSSSSLQTQVHPDASRWEETNRYSRLSLRAYTVVPAFVVHSSS